MFLVLGSFVSALLGVSLSLLSLFLILLVLVQRGRGGGLTGALGGPGGQSAFGTKAGDMFTRITSVVALLWIALCAFTMWLMGNGQELGANLSGDRGALVAPSDGEETGAESATGGLGGAGEPIDLSELGLTSPEDNDTASDAGSSEATPPAAPADNVPPADAEPATETGEAAGESQPESANRDS